MTIESLREILEDMLAAASDDLRRAKLDGDEAEAELIKVERDTLARVIALIEPGAP
jgi:hypothetical protein